jgi:hypothetical protein
VKPRFSLPTLASHPHPERDPGQTQTAASPRALASPAEDLCATASQKTAWLGERKSRDMAEDATPPIQSVIDTFDRRAFRWLLGAYGFLVTEPENYVAALYGFIKQKMRGGN